MIAAAEPVHRPPQAKLLVVMRAGRSPTPLAPRSSISCGPATW